MKTLNVYTDGGCRCNPGIGAYAYAILLDDKLIEENAGFYEYTTNNEMELTAIYNALSISECYLSKDIDFINIHSDSMYAINCITTWGRNWIANGITGKANFLLIKRCIDLIDQVIGSDRVKFTKVKGHSGDYWNDYVDSLLNKCMDERTNQVTTVQSDWNNMKDKLPEDNQLCYVYDSKEDNIFIALYSKFLGSLIMKTPIRIILDLKLNADEPEERYMYWKEFKDIQKPQIK